MGSGYIPSTIANIAKLNIGKLIVNGGSLICSKSILSGPKKILKPVKKVYTRVKSVDKMATITSIIPAGFDLIAWNAPEKKSHLPTNPLVGGRAERISAAAIHKIVVNGIFFHRPPIFRKSLVCVV